MLLMAYSGMPFKVQLQSLETENVQSIPPGKSEEGLPKNLSFLNIADI